MRIGASRADRLGFIVFAVLLALLAILLVTLTRGGEAETAQEQEVAVAPATPTPLPTTAPVALPEPTPSPTPQTLPTATPTPTPEPTPTPDASEADGGADTGGPDQTAGTASRSASTAGSSTETGSATTTSGTTPAATAVPNPQPAATAVPNPQPGPTEVPNPQPSTGGTVDVPVAAPVGGTFTHTLTSKVPQPTLYSSAGGSTFMPTFNGTALPPVNPTVFGNPLVYRVLAGEPGDAWAQVYVPARPNGTTAWVQTSQFNWGQSSRMVVINVTSRTVTVQDGGSVLLTTDAVLGKSSSRTPVANGWVEEIMPGPSGAYGPLLISLGIFSNDLNSFGGSIPKVALHGTNNPSLMGTYSSNGCIRVPNDVITQIAGMVQPGSKVIITS